MVESKRDTGKETHEETSITFIYNLEIFWR